MANYYGHGRSNYVNFTDPERVKAIGKFYGLTLIADKKGYCFISDDNNDSGDYGNTMEYVGDEVIDELKALGLMKNDDGLEEGDELELPDFLTAISQYIPDGEVFIWMHIGNEKLRYFSGYSIAINNKLEIRKLDINDIFDLANEIGDKDKITIF